MPTGSRDSCKSGDHTPGDGTSNNGTQLERWARAEWRCYCCSVISYNYSDGYNHNICNDVEIHQGHALN